MASAWCRSTETSWGAPRSPMVTPNSRPMRALVPGLGVMAMERAAGVRGRAREVEGCAWDWGEPAGVLGGLRLGAQVDRADGVALALQVVQVGLDAAGVGGNGDGLVGQLAGQLFRLESRGFAD